MTALKDMTLDEMIHDLATRGEISDIGLCRSQDGKLWRGTFAMCSKFGLSIAEDADPVKALMLACSTAKIKAYPKPRVRDEFDKTLPQATVEVEPSGIEDLM